MNDNIEVQFDDIANDLAVQLAEKAKKCAMLVARCNAYERKFVEFQAEIDALKPKPKLKEVKDENANTVA